jgi:hypothetical protein
LERRQGKITAGVTKYINFSLDDYIISISQEIGDRLFAFTNIAIDSSVVLIKKAIALVNEKRSPFCHTTIQKSAELSAMKFI